MLWGNPAVIAGLLLGQTFAKQGSKMKLGTVLGVGEMPFYYFTDKDGDQVALPCTERLMSARLASLLTSQSLIPLVCMKGAPEVRLGGFVSVAGRELAGPWAPVPTQSASPLTPEPAPSSPDEEEAAETKAEESEPAPETEAAAAEPEANELDALLAGLTEKTEEKKNEADAAEMDPDLAALLSDLG
jgi:type VI secretion system protein ImpC